MLPIYAKTSNQGFFPSFFNDFFNDSWITPQFHSTSPAINVSEDDKGYKVEIAAPGMTKEDFNISISDGDIVIAMSAATNSNYASQYRLPGIPAPTADFGLLMQACKAAEELKLPVHVGQVYTTDCFYDDSEGLAQWQKIGVLATEMECAALYMNAARLNRHALTICTVSDCPLTGESCSSDEREKSFAEMMELGFALAARL